MKLKPIELDWDVLKMTVKETSHNYFDEQWTESVCKSYLHTHAINNHACDRIIANCKNLMAKRMANELNDKNIAVDIITNQAKLNQIISMSSGVVHIGNLTLISNVSLMLLCIYCF